MKQKLLRFVYYLARPGIYLVLHNSQRSRVFVVCDDSLLLIRSDFGSRHWTLPGGGIKRGETPAGGAQRELFEEVGVQVTQRQLKKVTQRTKGFGPLSWPRIHLLFFVVHLKSKPRLNLQAFEVSESQWVSLQELQQVPDLGPTFLDVLHEIDLAAHL